MIIIILILILPLAFQRRAMGTHGVGTRLMMSIGLVRLDRFLVVNPADCPLANLYYHRIMRPKPR